MQRIKMTFEDNVKDWIGREMRRRNKSGEEVAKACGIPLARFRRYLAGVRYLQFVDFENLCIYFQTSDPVPGPPPIKAELMIEGMKTQTFWRGDVQEKEQEKKQEAELEPLTPFEAAKELGSVSVHSALEFFTVCQYMEAAGLTLCRKKRQEDPDGRK